MELRALGHVGVRRVTSLARGALGPLARRLRGAYRQRSSRLARSAALTLGTILLVLSLFAVRIPILELIELKTYDLRVQLRRRMAPSGTVLIAAIDEKSLQAEGRWPWPRSKLAALVDALSRDGAKVVGFDIAFPEPDQGSDPALVVELARRVGARADGARLASLVQRTAREADGDRALARSVQRSSAAVVLGYFFHLRQSDLGYELAPDEIAARVGQISGSKYAIIVSRELELAPVAPYVRAYAPQPNIDALTRVASSSGFFSVLPDQDGVVRWAPLAVQAGDEVFPPLGLLCAWEFLGQPALVLRVGPYGVEAVELGDVVIPTHETGQLLINYLGPPRTFEHVSITDILHGNFAPGTFKDRIVLVGATAVGTYDLRSTPVAAVHPGTEIHATVIDNILTGRFLDRPLWWRAFDVLDVIGLTILAAALLHRLGAVKGLILQTTVFGLFLAFAAWLFARFGVWLDVVHPALALSVNYTGLTTFRFLNEERERRRIKSTFRQYVAPGVVEEMLKNPQQLTLGGEEKVLTVLFSDLEGFTSYSERFTPREMIQILSEYYGRVTEQVFAFRGTLKEYVGDELMAFFGAPFEQADHAVRACAAALAMRQQRDALNVEWAEQGRPRLVARTGINSGPMLVGNLGSRYRFAYGVLGDQVNLGSRLEGLNRVYGTEILLGENTARLVETSFQLREVDLVRAKGKKVPVRVYELLAPAAACLPPHTEDAVRLYGAALEAYRAQRWGEALALLDEAIAASPEDGPSRAIAARCRAYQESPPPEDWDGVFDQTLKSLKGIS